MTSANSEAWQRIGGDLRYLRSAKEEKDPRILVITSRYPCPPTRGDKLRIYHQCRMLSERCSVTVLSFADPEMSSPPKLPSMPICDEAIVVRFSRLSAVARAFRGIWSKRPLQQWYYSSSRFENYVKQLVPRHDLVLVHLARMGKYIESDIRIPRVLEMTDAVSMAYKRAREFQAGGFWRLVRRFEADRLLRLEKRYCSLFDLVSLVSEVDKDYLAEHEADVDGVIVAGNGVEPMSDRVAKKNGGIKGRPEVVFLGNMNAQHNIDSCTKFIRDIWPRVRAEKSEVLFRIVGVCSEATRRKFERSAGVRVTGKVADVKKSIRGAVCGVCCPVSASGLQNKVLEYMAAGVPVVCNKQGAEGIEACSGRHLLVRDSDEEIASAILMLLNEGNLRERLAKAGQNLVQTQYQWSTQLGDWVESIVSLVPEDERGTVR